MRNSRVAYTHSPYGRSKRCNSVRHRLKVYSHLRATCPLCRGTGRPEDLDTVEWYDRQAVEQGVPWMTGYGVGP